MTLLSAFTREKKRKTSITKTEPEASTSGSSVYPNSSKITLASSSVVGYNDVAGRDNTSEVAPSSSTSLSPSSSSQNSPSNSTSSSTNSSPSVPQTPLYNPSLAAEAVAATLPQISRYGRQMAATSEVEEATMPCLAYGTARPVLASEDFGPPPAYHEAGRR